MLVVGLSLTACSSNGSEAGNSDENSFNIGEPLQDSTLAVVVESDAGSDTLSAEQFQGQVQNVMRRMPQAQGNLDRLRVQMVQQFINRHALLAEAKERGISVSDEQIDQRIEQIKGQFPDEQTFQQFLQQQGMTVEEMRAQLSESMLIQNFVDQVRGEVEEPSEAEIEEYRTEQAEEVSAQHILFQVGSDQDSTAVKDTAQAVLDSAQAGEDFAELAQRHSDGPSASQGGSLGYFSRDEMVPAFSEVAFALSDSGDVADEVVKTQYGYHVIRLTGRRTAEPVDSSEAKQKMVQKREQEAVMDLIDSLQPSITVRVNPNMIDPEKLQS